jgi:N-acetylmuramoyl-L-alanine amidase
MTDDQSGLTLGNDGLVWQRLFATMPRRFSLIFTVLAALWGAMVPVEARSFSSVVIDAGHGAHDFGCHTGSLVEKHLALDISRRLDRFLRQSGVRTIMTRTTDRFVPLDTRASIGNRNGRCLFVSVHVNEGARTEAAGIETFYFSESGRKLASLVQRQIIANANTGGNRGIKFARFRVLRMSTKPAILVETGFASNPRDRQRLRDPAYREAMAQSIGLGLLQYRR